MIPWEVSYCVRANTLTENTFDAVDELALYKRRNAMQLLSDNLILEWRVFQNGCDIVGEAETHMWETNSRNHCIMWTNKRHEYFAMIMDAVGTDHEFTKRNDLEESHKKFLETIFANRYQIQIESVNQILSSKTAGWELGSL